MASILLKNSLLCLSYTSDMCKFVPISSGIDFFLTQMGSGFHFWISLLDLPDFDKISTLEPFIR